MSNVHHLAVRWLCVVVTAASLNPLMGQSAILALSDSISRPGQMCAITADQPFLPQETYYVVFGNQSVTALGSDEAGRLWAQIPQVDAGLAAVKVYNSQQSWSGKNIQILPAPALTLTLSGVSSFQVLQKTPASTWWSAHPGHHQPLLAYDLIDNKGRLVFSTVIVDPFECGGEVFEGPDKPLYRQAALEDVQFTVWIPNLPQLTEIRFYKVPTGINTGTEQGFQQRIYVGNCYF